MSATMTPGVELLPRSGAEPARPRPSFRRRLFRRFLRAAGGRHLCGAITHVTTSAPVAALTFDDGPDPATTPQLLEILRRHGAKATFFMLGHHAARHRALVESIADEGHAIGNHSFNHPRFPSLIAVERRRQITACQTAIAPYGEKLFRPPRGLQSLASRLDVARLGYDVVTWNVCGEDWKVQTPVALASRLRDQVRPGSIVLLHDVLYDADDPDASDRTSTFAGLDLFLKEAVPRLSFVTVPALLTYGWPHRGLWIVRSDDDWAGHDPS